MDMNDPLVNYYYGGEKDTSNETDVDSADGEDDPDEVDEDEDDDTDEGDVDDDTKVD